MGQPQHAGPPCSSTRLAAAVGALPLAKQLPASLLLSLCAGLALPSVT